MYSQIFFTNILRLLDERDMTKAELAELAEISNSFLTDITLDKANPSLKIMEAISFALGEPLPAMLELTDLDKETLAVLANGKNIQNLPDGYTRVSAILTKYQAYIVQLWEEENRKHLLTQKHLLTKNQKKRRIKKKK